jgi:hypothetical protein
MHGAAITSFHLGVLQPSLKCYSAEVSDCVIQFRFFKAFLEQPGRPDPNLQRVEQFNAQVINGQLILPPRTLGLGVTFWRILR